MSEHCIQKYKGKVKHITKPLPLKDQRLRWFVFPWEAFDIDKWHDIAVDPIVYPSYVPDKQIETIAIPLAFQHYQQLNFASASFLRRPEHLVHHSGGTSKSYLFYLGGISLDTTMPNSMLYYV